MGIVPVSTTDHDDHHQVRSSMRKPMLHGRRLAVAVGALAVVGLTTGSLAASAHSTHATAGSTLVVDKSSPPSMLRMPPAAERP